MKSVINLSIIAGVMAILFLTACKKETPAGTTSSSLPPKADFSYTISNSQVIPDTIMFTDKSANVTGNGVSYKWYFSTGNSVTSTTATTSSAMFVYNTLNYTGNPLTVKLVVTSPFGKDSVTKQVSLSQTIITYVSGGLAGGVANITGINFANGVSNNQVTINGSPATVLSATTTGINFIVPANATSGKLNLTTNGTTISTNFSVYVFSIAPPNIAAINTRLKHLAFNSTITPNGLLNNSSTEVIGDNETDTLFSDLHSITGSGNQYNQTLIVYSPIIAPAVKLLGIAPGYAVGNDYRVYSYNKALLSTTVLAGNGASGFADAQGTSAQFVTPMGIASDGAGNLYVTDGNRVRKIVATTGAVSTLAGSGADGHTDGQGTAATFGSLYGIAVDASGNIYVSDTKYPGIRKITPTGTVTTVAGSGVAGLVDGTGTAAKFASPKGIAIDSFGDIFVTDTYNTTSTVRMINPLGLVTTVLSSANGDNLINPDGIIYAGGLIICNTGSANQPYLQVNLVTK